MIPIVGARTRAQLDENLASLNVTLDAAQRARLDRATEIDLGMFVGSWVAGQGPRSVIAECKSYGVLHNEEDALRSIDQLQSLAAHFTETVFVFAAL